MSWWGKIIGGSLGYMMGGPIGALLGVALGHHFDKGLAQDFEGSPFGYSANKERTQTAFFTAVFSVMGHLAKADGRVSADEIAMARAMMQQMSLNEQQTQLAIELFNQGKQSDFDLPGVIAQFKRECHHRRTLVQMFIEILLHAAYADGEVHPNERKVLERVTLKLGFSPLQFQQLEAMVVAQHGFHQHQQGYGHTAPSKNMLREAYQALGVKESATDAEVKKAYRRLMNQHHPDKLTAKGMPEEMIKLATEKTQEIKAAYDVIKKSRK